LPRQEKIDKAQDIFMSHGYFDKPLVVSCQGTKYILEDRYVRYYVALQLGVQEIDAVIGTKEQCTIEDNLKYIGTKITHQKYGNGKIIDINGDIITVEFTDGKKVRLSISYCVKNQIILILK